MFLHSTKSRSTLEILSIASSPHKSIPSNKTTHILHNPLSHSTLDAIKPPLPPSRRRRRLIRTRPPRRIHRRSHHRHTLPIRKTRRRHHRVLDPRRPRRSRRVALHGAKFYRRGLGPGAGPDGGAGDGVRRWAGLGAGGGFGFGGAVDLDEGVSGGTGGKIFMGRWMEDESDVHRRRYRGLRICRLRGRILPRGGKRFHSRRPRFARSWGRTVRRGGGSACMRLRLRGSRSFRRG